MYLWHVELAELPQMELDHAINTQLWASTVFSTPQTIDPLPHFAALWCPASGTTDSSGWVCPTVKFS